MIYLDNAATSFPKPEAVYEAASRSMREAGGNPGRSGHRLSVSAGRIIEEARALLAQLFNAPRPEQIAYTLNATDAINLALKGVLKPGDHVVTSSVEHNAVIRPLEALKSTGVDYTRVTASPQSGVRLDEVAAAIRGNTKLMVFTHISNVTGTVNPIAEIGALCREHGILLLVDASQSAGLRPIDVRKMNIDLMAFPGHKGLFGLQGTGGLYISEDVDVRPLREGGTGSRSEKRKQPFDRPGRYESGTLNTPGIAGLAAGVKYLLNEGIDAICKKEAALVNRLISGLGEIDGVRLHGPSASRERSGVVSITMEGIDPMEVSMILDSAFDIAVRAGLHCAPDAHETIGTLQTGGTIRISAGRFNTEQDIDACLSALASISGS
jgi:cysteine desulfurase family protein